MPRKHQVTSRYIVLEDWTASYPDPISGHKGDVIVLDGRKDVWDGYTWVWAKNLLGKEGWLPDALVIAGEPARLAEDYSALELNCVKGEVLLSQKSTHGWVLCRNTSGGQGWVPSRNLREYQATGRR